MIFFYFFLTRYTDNVLGKIVLCAGGLILSFVVIRKFIEDIKVVKTITIYENGIDVDDITVVWANISGMYISGQAWMSRSPVYMLWLALKDGTYLEFNITSYPYDNIGNILAHYLYVYNPMQEQETEEQKERLISKNNEYFYTYKNGIYNRID